MREDSPSMSGSSENFDIPSNVVGERKLSNKSLVASSPGNVVPKVTPLKSLREGRRATSHVVLFLIEIATVEIVRRFSRARCPIIWRSVQGLQLLSFLPFKWVQKLMPLRIIVKGVQKFTRPLLLISMASAFSDNCENSKKSFDGVDDSQSQPDSSGSKSTSDTRNCSESLTKTVPESWLLGLYAELENQGISLPERIDEDEIRRFYAAANGDFPFLLASLKRTISWRENYHILSPEELEVWSHLVFWHGFDVMSRPCLIIRLGLACSSLRRHDRPRFVQAVVSQIEHGAVHLISGEDPRITVLMDCEGLTPFRFPMHVMRSCCNLVQEHYPGRLGKLFVIRLPPVVRVIAQTFIQMLKPTTRQKLRVEGVAYQKVLLEFLQSVPAYLGGKCTCSNCELLPQGNARRWIEQASVVVDPSGSLSGESVPYPSSTNELSLNDDSNHVLKAVIVGILMIWIAVAFAAGMRDQKYLQFLFKVLP